MPEDTPTLPPAPVAGAILVVDDQGFVRRAIARGLASLGTRVLEAEDLAGARAVLESEPSIALVLIDMVLPDGRGTELLDHLRSARPDSCVVLMSGFVTHDDVEQAQARGALGCLAKPFTTTDLLPFVRRACAAA